MMTIVSLSSSANEHIQVTGVFSSLYYNEEGGDLLGNELIVSYGGQGNYYVSVQCAQGGVRGPFIVKALITENQITFNVPDNNSHLCATGNFKGSISASKLTGTFGDGSFKVNLPRKNSYWQ